MRKDKQRALSSEVLVANFQSAFAALATAEYANHQAQRSENEVVTELHDLSNRTYLNPSSINPMRQTDIGRASLNAHVMKVQAAQLQQLSQEQLTNLQAQTASDYLGRKVVVTALKDVESPFDAVWFNSQAGYRSNVYKKPSLSGTIINIDLSKNLLIVKPKLLPRLINRELTAYFVYVVDPATLQPAVKINFG